MNQEQYEKATEIHKEIEYITSHPLHISLLTDYKIDAIKLVDKDLNEIMIDVPDSPLCLVFEQEVKRVLNEMKSLYDQRLLELTIEFDNL